MKKTRTLFALTLTLACLGFVRTVTVNAFNPEPSARGSAQSINLMLTFRAVQLQDGSVKATFRDRAAHTSVDIDIDCLVIFNQQACLGCGQLGAILSGVVSESSFSGFQPGDLTSFVVREGGDGEYAQPDAFTPPADGGTCLNLGPILAFYGSEQGKIVLNR